MATRNASAAPVTRLPTAAAREVVHITFDGLGKIYPGASSAVLQDISFAVQRGESFGIIGRSGAGKSTLLRTINALELPGVGHIKVDGVDIASLDDEALVGLREIDPGLIEAARAMGCRRWHIVRHVLLPEALPAILGGATVTVIARVGASAMAGAVGAGGLGDLAVRYGYERYETSVMFNVIVILVALVTLVQRAGERLARRVDHRR
ncbi:ABC transporter permease [Pandoraea capi]|uniref:ABC transporter permease n=1 Tax=Pandoraea capi TaxID=2508286 RepID=A0ABY6W849_9BURK|nr:ABC transporter permease subunit [Pandoraea capi]VVE38355.1 ABC transporter permease [Pandoraea capi]